MRGVSRERRRASPLRLRASPVGHARIRGGVCWHQNGRAFQPLFLYSRRPRASTSPRSAGGKEKNKHLNKKLFLGRGGVGKSTVIGAVERGGRVKTAHIRSTSQDVIHAFIKENVNIDSTLYTDYHRSYQGLFEYRHEAVNHSVGEYVRGNAHTNGIESFWSLLKRGHYGVFHHFSVKHLHRYLAEFESRWNMTKMDGGERLDLMLESAPGLRLTYQRLTQ